MELSPKEISGIPTEPGCYIFKCRSEEQVQILYVGKAKNLRSRVRQYFQSDTDTRCFVEFIRERTTHIEYIATKDERDALLLENELIKKHRPLYNILLKDDKRFLSLRMDLKHEWPRIEVVRKIKKDSAVYLGPFSSSTRLKEALNIIQKLFQLRSCPDSKLYNRSRPCIEYEIKRCVAPCVAYVSKEDYRERVDSVVMFLQGRSEELIQKLESQMKAAAEQESYEEAAKLRDQIEALRSVTQSGPAVINQKMQQSGTDADAFGIAQDEKRTVVFALFIRGGLIWDQRSFEFSGSKLDENEILSQLISRYYSGEVYIPKEILLDRHLEIPGLPQSLSILKPRAKEKLNFVEMAVSNARSRLENIRERKEKLSKVLDELQAKLKLDRRPEKMDCFDISHHQGKEVVASVVRFSDGVPDKSFYRKMKLSQEVVDDYASMKEAISRRYKNSEDLPDLIVVDGGRGQLSSAASILQEKDWLEKVDLVGLAKARSSDSPIDPLNPMNRERVFKIGQKNPILLKESSKEELLLSFLRDEAHRFAITYHRLRKERGLSFSVLDQVAGLSSRMKLKLLRQFGSIEGIQEASDYDLLKLVKPQVLENLRSAISGAGSEE